MCWEAKYWVTQSSVVLFDYPNIKISKKITALRLYSMGVQWNIREIESTSILQVYYFYQTRDYLENHSQSEKRYKIYQYSDNLSYESIGDQEKLTPTANTRY